MEEKTLIPKEAEMLLGFLAQWWARSRQSFFAPHGTFLRPKGKRGFTKMPRSFWSWRDGWWEMKGRSMFSPSTTVWLKSGPCMVRSVSSDLGPLDGWLYEYSQPIKLSCSLVWAFGWMATSKLSFLRKWASPSWFEWLKYLREKYNRNLHPKLS